ncbi:MAG: hypothetical protein ACK559_39345, partial [bacterium]
QRHPESTTVKDGMIGREGPLREDRPDAQRHQRDADPRTVRGSLNVAEDQEHRQGDTRLEGVEEERVLEHANRGEIHEAAGDAPHPEMAIHGDEPLPLVEPEIERRGHAAEKRQRLPGHAVR